MTRRKPTREQLQLLSELVRAKPTLQSLIPAVAVGEELDDIEVNCLEEVILSDFTSELDGDGEPTERGRKLDELLGLISQLRRGYYRAPG